MQVLVLWGFRARSGQSPPSPPPLSETGSSHTEGRMGSQSLRNGTSLGSHPSSAPSHVVLTLFPDLSQSRSPLLCKIRIMRAPASQGVVRIRGKEKKKTQQNGSRNKQNTLNVMPDISSALDQKLPSVNMIFPEDLPHAHRFLRLSIFSRGRPVSF